MRIWFDTEFYEDGRTIELISIGAIREDGSVFYRETIESRRLATQGDGWLRANVLPHLREPAPVLMTPKQIGQQLIAFAGERPEWWAYYADYDWVVLCQMFGRMIDLPKGWPMYCRDLKQLADQHNVTLPAQEGLEHHALADAKWTRNAHLWLEAYLAQPACEATP